MALSTNYIAKSSNEAHVENLTDSVIYDDGTNVGIGTTNPNTKLEIVGDGASEGLRITEATDTRNRIGLFEDGTNGGVLVFTSNGGARYRGTLMAHDFLFQTYSGGWQDRAVIDVNGNVRICGGGYDTGHLIIGNHHIWVGNDNLLHHCDGPPESSNGGNSF